MVYQTESWVMLIESEHLIKLEHKASSHYAIPKKSDKRYRKMSIGEVQPALGGWVFSIEGV